MEKLLKLQNNTKSKIENFIRNYKSDGKENKTRAYYETRINRFEKYWEEFKERNEKIVVSANDEVQEIEKYFVDDIYSSVEDFHIESLALIVSDFHQDYPPVTPEAINNEYTLNATIKQDDVKLPKISLPTFSGDYLEWSTFYDLFKALVHENERLSPVQKFQYLKAHLAGEARSLISNTAITSANYRPAWKTLIERYDNKRILVKAQLDVLFNQPSVSQESAKGVKGLLDKTSECIAALQNLNINVENWDPILVYFITQRLPYETLELWEQSLSSEKDLPKWDQLKQFLESRFRTLEVMNVKRKPAPRETKPTPQNEKPWRRAQTFHIATSSPCFLCRELHAIRQCPKYLSFNHQSRLQAVKSKGLCLNCLGTGHLVANCPSKLKCLICKKLHHTTLHKDQAISENLRTEHVVQPESARQTFVVTNNDDTPVETQSFVVSQSSRPQQILLATALVRIVAPNGLEQICRALIDPGSQASFVTEHVAQTLRLPKEFIDAHVTGLGNTSTEKIKASTKLIVKAKNYRNEPTITVRAFVIKRITNVLPGHQIKRSSWHHLDGLELADPTFHQPGVIDILLGADVYPSLICDGIRKGEAGTPVGQRTIFGWILSGESCPQSVQPREIKMFHINVNPYEDLRMFWELEEIPTKPILSPEESQCEQHYSNSYIRCSSGRYQVSLPFVDDETVLGASRNIAVARLLQMEKRFIQDPHLKMEYIKCMDEYLELGHMEPTNTIEIDFIRHNESKNSSYACTYLPHHAILKPSSTTTKVRIVFDASRRTTNGKSLNDILLKGPTIQETLFAILLRWRRYKIAFMADVQKMYRQINIHPNDAEYQRIVWRDSQDTPIRDYKLTTVTFGVKSAPYLAIRTMQQLARDETHNYPIGAAAVLNDFYVDDLISGGNSVEEAILKQFQISRLLSTGGFELRKWASNNETILQAIPEENRELELPLSVESSDIKALGMLWNPRNDTLSYRVEIEIKNQVWTKRSILSEIAKLFDPIGWLAPITITAKILIQTLWLAGLQWDDEVPAEVKHEWNQYRENLIQIQRIQIPRWIRTGELLKVDLHGFCDASIKAYAAAVYVRTEHADGQVDVHLISAKTKVAPIKTISLPRLELCGANLLAKLIIEIQQILQLDINGTYAWTDSTIVLAWLKRHPSIWETFIANRVSNIHQLLKENCWAHVPTEFNPADCASRGMEPEKLRNHSLWWCGPSWLKKSKENWPKSKESVETTQGLRKNILSLHVHTPEESWKLLERYSSLTRLLRITAYCQRWISNTRSHPHKRKLKYLTSEELQSALIFWIKSEQTKYFINEKKALQEDRQIPRQSKLIKLNPFLHIDGLIRVGGRLQNSSLNFFERHPIILPEKSHLTNLIVDNMHKKTIHGGAQLMLSLIRRKYWILNGRNVVRAYNHKCMQCFRQTAQTRMQLMANLPSFRVQRARPFAHTGIDYCGPFDVKSSKGRGTRSYKGYIAVFICMVTKAMHLEIVSDLSTAGFLAAFRRFVSRRGLCTDLYSDCGSNFIGANGVLTRYKLEMTQQIENEIAQAIENQGSKWHFIPPSSPHFGGLWESGVKSVKTHLKRIIGNAILTFEEFSTLLTQIEASLNSRPLTEMSQDPEDMSALTPGHFLIGGALLTLPEPTLLETNINRLDRYQYVQRLFQTFWTRWSTEYLHRLQQRPKWLSKEINLRENELVLIKDERLPPSRWLMGRIIETHPGKDNLTRVVTIKTQNNVLKRPITKICLLPIETAVPSN